MKNKKYIVLIIVGIVVIILLAIWMAENAGGGNVGHYDDFAKCLTDSGAKMYGASWCSHCKEQKEMFGASWRYVDYIECATAAGGQNQICADAKIDGYPTWEFKNGERVSGKLSFEELSQKTGCPISQSSANN